MVSRVDSDLVSEGGEMDRLCPPDLSPPPSAVLATLTVHRPLADNGRCPVITWALERCSFKARNWPFHQHKIEVERIGMERDGGVGGRGGGTFGISICSS